MFKQKAGATPPSSPEASLTTPALPALLKKAKTHHKPKLDAPLAFLASAPHPSTDYAPTRLKCLVLLVHLLWNTKMDDLFKPERLQMTAVAWLAACLTTAVIALDSPALPTPTQPAPEHAPYLPRSPLILAPQLATPLAPAKLDMAQLPLLLLPPATLPSTPVLPWSKDPRRHAWPHLTCLPHLTAALQCTIVIAFQQAMDMYDNKDTQETISNLSWDLPIDSTRFTHKGNLALVVQPDAPLCPIMDELS
jgi:hypothetical protein